MAALLLHACTIKTNRNKLNTYPINNAQQINPDTHLKIKFNSKPKIGKTGMIRIYDRETNQLVDSLDLSIPSGPNTRRNNPDAGYTKAPYEYVSGNFTNANTKPGTPSGLALPDTGNYQLTIIGGFTDGFHFYPIIIHDSTAIIYLHHNLLNYNKQYYVLIDSTAIVTSNGEFKGIYKKGEWNFTTKTNKPDISSKILIVNDNGTGQFNTLQGALDYIPDYCEDTITILIKNGVYEELIYFRNKTNIFIKGENREEVIIQYANNEVFNPHPWEIKTNEWPGTFPSRRAAFAIDNCKNIQLQNLTVKSLSKGQSEGLLINGDKILISKVNIVGDGDALQTNGRAYFEDVQINGGGDMILGRGPAFFNNCVFYSPGPFMWVRNTNANHGNIFVSCKFIGTNPEGSQIARAPQNGGKFNYLYSEAVLINCKLENIVPQGWGKVADDTKNIRFWEYNSTNLSDGSKVDVSKRSEFSKQLTWHKHKELIENYSNPSFILNGWQPKLYITNSDPAFCK